MTRQSARVTERAVAIKIDGIAWSAGAPQPILLQTDTSAFTAFQRRTRGQNDPTLDIDEAIGAGG